jgi:hypothetical protein
VTVTTLRAGTDLTSALTANVPIKVMHLTEGQGNHVWTLGSDEEKLGERWGQGVDPPLIARLEPRLSIKSYRR